MKKITLYIDADDLKKYRESGYKLCIARQVNDSFTTIWKTIELFHAQEEITWEPGYKIFVSEEPYGNADSLETLPQIPLKPGEAVCLGPDMDFDQPTTGDDAPESIIINNNFGHFYPGVADKNGIPIYLAQHAVVSGKTRLTPKEILSLWFQQDAETTTVISKAVGNSFTADLTAQDSIAIRFKNQKFSVANEPIG